LNEVQRNFREGCFIEVSRVFQGCLKEVEWVFGRVLQGVSRMFQGCFKEVLGVF